jgi:hypothetical protein
VVETTPVCGEPPTTSMKVGPLVAVRLVQAAEVVVPVIVAVGR